MGAEPLKEATDFQNSEGSQAQAVIEAFMRLSAKGQCSVLDFLKTIRLPVDLC